MKKYGKTIVIIAIFALIGLGYYYYLANKPIKKDASDIAAEKSKGEASELISKNISSNYPDTPREVVKLYIRITQAYYATELTDQEIEALGKQARLLFDDELNATQSEKDFLEALKADIKDYKAAKRKINYYSLESGTKTKYTTFEGRQYSSIIGQYYIREGTNSITSTTKFTLRKDDKGKWKILFWNLATPNDLDD